jgi:ABC-2 type transport system permease protein
VSAPITFATALRVLQQLRRDPRTVALLLALPMLLTGLLAWVYNGSDTFDTIGAPLLGIFPFIVMFLVTSIATLRERTNGTLERLLTLPTTKADFILGYALAFGLLGILQAVLVSAWTVGVLGLDVQGPTWFLVVVAVADALLGTALGLSVSAFAATEFQAVQFMPLFVLPQLLVCGLLTPRSEMPQALQWVSDVLPLSYAVDAMSAVVASPTVTTEAWRDLLVVVAFLIAGLGLGAATLRRRTP